MLALDDPRWHTLRTGYTRAEKFLPLLRRMAEDPDSTTVVCDEFVLEQYVCHQGDVYETTVAVVPHFLRAASLLSPRARQPLLWYLGFPVSQLGSPLSPAPGLMTIDPPTDVVAAYNEAMSRGVTLTLDSLSCEWGEQELLGLMVALAAFRGQRRLASALGSVAGWVSCPSCDAEFEPLVEWGEYR